MLLTISFSLLRGRLALPADVRAGSDRKRGARRLQHPERSRPSKPQRLALKNQDLDIEATIDLEIWVEQAPEMMVSDQEWVATETRAAACAFHPSASSPPTDAERFEVDGTTVHFTVN